MSRPAIDALDPETREHLARWLDHARGCDGDEDRELALDRIGAALTDDPALPERGWTWGEIERAGEVLA